MSKFLFFLVLIISGLFYLFDLDEIILDKFTLPNDFKESYIEKLIKVESVFEKYFQNVMKYEEIKEENDELRKYRLLYAKLLNEKQREELKQKKFDDINLTKTKVLSYVKFDDFTEVWLDVEKKDSKIEALIQNHFAAGVVIKKANKAQALLNGNKKSNYAVFVGKNKAPGITHAMDNPEFIKIKFIPIWIKIQEGDEVITSGMDNIFFEGVEVGKVEKIITLDDMQEAIVKPYANTSNERNYYIYSTPEQNTSKTLDSNESNVSK